MMTMWEQICFLNEILSRALHDPSSADKMVKMKSSWGDKNRDAEMWSLSGVLQMKEKNGYKNIV